MNFYRYHNQRAFRDGQYINYVNVNTQLSSIRMSLSANFQILLRLMAMHPRTYVYYHSSKLLE